VIGVQNPEQLIPQLEKEISNRISPPLQCTVDMHETSGKKVLRVLVPRGDDPPNAVDDNKIYVRDEAETGLAVRDEIVGLVMRGHKERQAVAPAADVRSEIPKEIPAAESAPEPENEDIAPRTGVEVVTVTERDGSHYYTMRDLRNGNVVKNVTRTSARRLWHYAITEFDKLPEDVGKADIQWNDGLGLIKRHKQGNVTRYDLIQHTPDGYRYFFGVTDDGIRGSWKELVGPEDERE
jgi:hypothetical protein